MDGRRHHHPGADAWERAVNRPKRRRMPLTPMSRVARKVHMLEKVFMAIARGAGVYGQAHLTERWHELHVDMPDGNEQQAEQLAGDRAYDI